MSMSDCEKCWDTPCNCGWDYRDYSKDQAAELVAAVVSNFSDVDVVEVLRLAAEIRKVEETRKSRTGV